MTRYIIRVITADGSDIEDTEVETKDRAIEIAEAMVKPGSLSMEPGDTVVVIEVKETEVARFTKATEEHQ